MLKLLSQALDVWITINVKINNLKTLLGSAHLSRKNKDTSTILLQGLDVKNLDLEKQPQLFIRNNVEQVTQLLEPCFNNKLLNIGK